jgi:uncharacterized membrane protein YqjE
MLKDSYQKVWEESKKYLELRYDLLRVELLEKTSRICALLLMAIVALLLGVLIFTYLSVLLLVWLDALFGSFIPGLCIVIGVHLVLLACVFAFKNQWFINPLLRQFSKILFNDTENKEPQP